MPTVTNRGRALTQSEVSYYFNTLPTITPTDLENVASLLYGMQHDVFMVCCGWECTEGYTNCTLNPHPDYDGYMCSCVAVNRYAGYGYITPQALCDSIRVTDPSYTVASMTANTQAVFDNYTGATQQRTMKALYLSFTNPDQRVYGFSGWNAGVIIYELINWSYQRILCSTLVGGTKTYGYTVDGGVLGGGYDVYADNGPPTKLSEFRATIFHALACPTQYSAVSGENLGYWHGSYFSFDCVNLIKTILGGWFDNRNTIGLCKPGFYMQMVNRIPGDVNEFQLLSLCQNVSYDFSNLSLTSVLYWDDGEGAGTGHIGCYVGDFVRDGKTYNTIEATTGNPMGSGVVASYVTSTGIRKNDKDAPYGDIRWLAHGLLTTWLIYDVGNIDPGGSISPVDPGGGGVDPPWWESPDIPTFSDRLWKYMKRQDLLPKNRWKYI